MANDPEDLLDADSWCIVLDHVMHEGNAKTYRNFALTCSFFAPLCVFYSDKAKSLLCSKHWYRLEDNIDVCVLLQPNGAQSDLVEVFSERGDKRYYSRREKLGEEPCTWETRDWLSKLMSEKSISPPTKYLQTKKWQKSDAQFLEAVLGRDPSDIIGGYGMPCAAPYSVPFKDMLDVEYLRKTGRRLIIGTMRRLGVC